MHAQRVFTGITVGLGVLALEAVAQPRAPVATTLTYQGVLKDAGAPANGSYDLRFQLFDDAVLGVQQGPTVCAEDVDVADGLFTVTLNFGDVYANTALWMAIGVRADATPGNCGAGVYTTIAPRQSVTLTPFSAYSLDTDMLDGQSGAFFQNASNLNAGTVADARLSSNVMLLNNAQTVTGVKTFSTSPSFSNGVSPFAVTSTSLVTNLNADLLDGQHGSFYQNAANLNAGTIADARLSANVALLNTAQTFTAVKSFSADVNFTSDDASLIFPAADAVNSPMMFMFASGTTNGDRMVIAHGPANPGWGLRYDDSGDQFHFTNSGTEKLTIGLSQGDLSFSDDSASITFPAADALNAPMINMFASGTTNDPRMVLAHSSAFPDWGLRYSDVGDAFDFIAGGTTRVTIDLNGSAGAFLVVDGTARVDVLEIVGADVAEKFPITASAQKVEPGHVVAIDATRPGQLCLGSGAYSTQVAGVVSGANGLPAGTILGNLPGSEDSVPIALSGRVWCWCDASSGPIAAGDLLTTSDTPGHAMKSADRDRSHGAVLGKAMTELREGRGLVLVLVNLQ